MGISTLVYGESHTSPVLTGEVVRVGAGCVGMDESAAVVKGEGKGDHGSGDGWWMTRRRW